MQLSRLVALLSSFSSLLVVKAGPEHANEVRSPFESLGKRGLNRYELVAEKRAVCNRDNVLRALLANSASASSFCSSYISIPLVTSFGPGPTPFPTPVTT